MSRVLLQVAMLLLVTFSAFAQGPFPLRADPGLTPGSFCATPNSYRYNEHMPYCDRAVEYSEKWDIINTYNQKLGYQINQSNRSNFKIDHLVPLCAGGSNQINNLWPQHVSVYTITDPVEAMACQRLSEGKINQRRAVELILQAKYHLEQTPQVISILEHL